METLTVSLPVLIYFLLIILLIICIILGIRFIITMKKIENMVDDINNKVQSLNGFFNIIDFATDKVSSVIDVVVNFVTNKISWLFKKKKKEESEIDE